MKLSRLAVLLALVVAKALCYQLRPPAASTRARYGDDRGEVRERYYGSQSESPPFQLIAGMDDGVQAGDDENEMCDATDKYHHGIRSPDLPRAHEAPNQHRAGLDQMGDEKAQTVPNNCNRDSRAVSPRTLSKRKNDDRNVDESLKNVEKTKLRNHQRRYRQSDEEQHCAKRNPQAR